MKNRIKFLRLIVCLGLLAGICFSFELWFAVNRTFPRAPLIFELPENSVIHVERCLTVILAASLVSIIFSRRLKIAFVAAVASLLLLILFDQNRLQPWVYQYFLLLFVLALRARQTEDESGLVTAIGLTQIIIAGLYFWSGAQKLNFSFSHEILPALLSPLENLFPDFQFSFPWLGIGAAFAEISIGVGLLLRRTRNSAVYSAAVMHLIILFFLIANGYNSIVWIWNATLIPMVFAAFWRFDVALERAIRTNGGLEGRTAKSITAASVLLPVLSFFGWWDMYLSGALYSGNVEVAAIRINRELIEKLPPEARENVFQTKKGNELMLPLFEWAMRDLNVPAYPERRVSKAVTGKVCELTNEKNQVELIVKERPAISDGSFRISRISCAEIDGR
ncbi:MAG: hypothetical protein M3384_07995 [Acidobacteriota bacterium]|nr:hypothetical protein [Acidobacteriota bacterium]